MTLTDYLRSVATRLNAGNATEHTYRGDLEALLRELTTCVQVTNEPRRVACGAPDYILTRKGLPVGYVEAKDIGKPLDSKEYKEQFDRYRKGLTNLIITDYLDFRWYKEGEFVQRVQLAELIDGKVRPLTQNFAAFEQLIQDFILTDTYTIRSATKLAELMAGKARMMDEVIKNALLEDTEHDNLSNLSGQYGAFKRVLLHDLSVMEFSDIYAQTVTYGMFAARLHDDTPETFSRQEAAELIPKTNPFLRWLFADIAGPNIDERIVWIVDALADIFRYTDMDQVLKDFGKATGQNDPLIHFYEPFLAAYSPALRKSRGVWYTPQPVVNFIVRAVDDILKTEFNLPQGLADTSKVKVKYKAVTQATADKRSNLKEVEVEREVHKVQILDPATGTGTFLAEVIRQMHSKFEGMEGVWPNYVEEHLLPRINGFELLMASYAMAHLKLDMVLRETGVDTTKLNKRLKVYLTNSLEEPDEQMPDLFSAALAREASEANAIKRDTPVMVVLGNPPYSISSSNTGDWILDLLNDYKKGLNERNIQPLSDDYIKFIRYGQHFIDNNGSGILAFITNNSYLDGVIHRQMRKSLATTFDKIYLIDLHGSSKRQEKDADGNKDENVFDIMPGTAIALFVKGPKDVTTEIYSVDVFGGRQHKYDFLEASSISTIDWNTIEADDSECFFIPRNTEGEHVFQSFIGVKSLFQNGANGIQTERDSVTIQFTPEDVLKVEKDFKELTEFEIASKYQIEKEGRDWKIANAKDDILSQKGGLVSVLYRPFDYRFSWYSGKTKGFMAYARPVISDHLVQKNVGLVVGRQGQIHSKGAWDIVHITKDILDRNLFYRGGNMTFPLYLYPSTEQLSTEGEGIRPNLDEKLAKALAVAMGCDYVFDEARAWEHGTAGKEVLPLDILDYTYAVLHSPAYREKYKEFLKIDFPRIPYCTDEGKFRPLVQLGEELRQYHLLEHPMMDQLRRIIGFPIKGNNEVTRKMTTASPGYVSTVIAKEERLKQSPSTQGLPRSARNDAEGLVYINDTQYFQFVPERAWEFYIGGYQPAQKWLKDRHGRILSFDDIVHYQKIIVALEETARLMEEIDEIGVV